MPDGRSRCEFAVPEDAESGIYAVRMCLTGPGPKAACVAPFVVTRRRPRPAGALPFSARRDNWHAYGRRPTRSWRFMDLPPRSIRRISMADRFFTSACELPVPLAHPYGFESRRSTRTRSTHLVRTERFLEAWLAREGYPYELIADFDLHEEPFAAAATSPRFSSSATANTGPTRRATGVIGYLDGGGKVLSLSGDTLSMRVTFDRTRSVIECRKVVYGQDPRWLAPPLWGESWHSDDGMPGGSYSRIGRPGWDVVGISFKGMIDDGTRKSFAPIRSLSSPGSFPVPGTDKVSLGRKTRSAARA